jgi:hypothetical protein
MRDIMSSGGYSKVCWKLVDGKNNKFWSSKDQFQSWVCFDFTSLRLVLTPSSLAADEISRHLTDCDVESSNDERQWTKFDEQWRCSIIGLADAGLESCPTENEKSFRYIWPKQMETNTSGDHYCMLSHVEFERILSDASWSTTQSIKSLHFSWSLCPHIFIWLSMVCPYEMLNMRPICKEYPPRLSDIPDVLEVLAVYPILPTRRESISTHWRLVIYNTQHL